MSVPHIMGVVNVTPDSFSDGGRFARPADAVEHGALLFEQGARIIDVGGESTRPGADHVDAEEERRRVMPVVAGLVERRIPVSIDTVNASTAAAAIGAGAAIVNDVSGGLADPGMGRVVADAGVHLVVQHWRGGTDAEPRYGDVVRDVVDELRRRVDELGEQGVPPERIILDPGLGFAKTAEHNWQLLGRLPELTALGHGVLIGASRKRFLGGVLPESATIVDRDLPTAVISALAARSGVWAVRVHDVPSTVAALEVWAAWERGAATAGARSAAATTDAATTDAGGASR